MEEESFGRFAYFHLSNTSVHNLLLIIIFLFCIFPLLVYWSLFIYQCKRLLSFMIYSNVVFMVIIVKLVMWICM